MRFRYARYEHLPIYKQAMDVAVHFEKLVAGFSRYHKYTLGIFHRERAGMPIDPNDLLIVAHARALNRILVTDNVREFSRVPGLAVENWLA